MRTLTAWRLLATLAAAAAALGVAGLVGLALGPSGLEAQTVWDALRSDAGGAAADIVWRIRLPRVVLAMAVGASLALSGVVCQALLRNPLADPYILGISGGAALGGIALLALGGAWGLGATAVPPAAFAGGLVSTGLLYAVAGGGGRFSATHLLLTGVVFNAFAAAAIVFLASLAGLREGTQIFLWLIGNLSAANIAVAPWVAAFLAVGLACTLPLARSLNLMTLGEESAQQLGVAVGRQRRVLLVACALMVSAAVSVAGLVGFVGLIIPHLLRLALGADHRLLVPASALLGAAFLVVCDTLGRSLLQGLELPVGAITALLGGPLFLFLLRRQQTQVLGP
ncbi:MAG: iron ABC transporter permease [Proteobacteria bacterium]|nr:iron ABC transporter permease [Pseudomonadota bacterium]